MAEVDVGGVKFKGGKLVVVFTLISTLGGGLWAGFEFYKDYMDMREKIESYTAPDLSGFDKKLATFKEKMVSLEDSVTQAKDYTRDIKNDLKSDLNRMETQIDNIEKLLKDISRKTTKSIERNNSQVRSITNDNIDKSRIMIDAGASNSRKWITEAENRFDSKREQIRNDVDNIIQRIKNDMKELRTQIDKKIKKALENPLAGMRK
tara:strand:- start:9967 stop:10584 length:618 start_codon:yes stop_codon:yes gene_type:complete